MAQTLQGIAQRRRDAKVAEEKLVTTESTEHTETSKVFLIKYVSQPFCRDINCADPGSRAYRSLRASGGAGCFGPAEAIGKVDMPGYRELCAHEYRLLKRVVVRVS